MSDVTKEELLANIKSTQEEGDWTLKYTDEQMLKTCQKLIDRSINIKKQCKQYGFMYYDTSTDREKTLNEIVDLLQKIN